MIGKLLNLCFNTSGPARGLHYNGIEKIGDFYASLSEGLNNLEVSLGSDSPSFSLSWLSLALSFVRSVHSNVLALIEELWLPGRASIGVDVLELYVEVSMRLLEMCNSLDDGSRQLESYQMSLDLALCYLASAVESLSSIHDDDTNHDSSKVLSSLQACKNELERMRSKRAPPLWADLVARLDQQQQKRQSSDALKKPDLTLQRSVSTLPSPSLDMKLLDISLVMRDVQVVCLFISCLLLWVLGDSSEDLKSTINLEEHGTKVGLMEWLACLLRLRAKVEIVHSKEARESFHPVNSVKEFEDVQHSICSLHQKIEDSLKEGGETALGSNSLEYFRAMLEKIRTKLAEILKSSEQLGSQTKETFSEIISSRSKLLDIVGNQLLRFPSI